ncbi:MAG: InlB B-repeat-containing protein [Clostridia bacterium]|nr:InlB B-repeat-containing protein [Clostridia bacterium]
MKKTQKKPKNKKLLIVILLLTFVFSIIKTGISLADDEKYAITEAEVIAKSEDVAINDFRFEKCRIASNVTFHRVGDSVRFRISVKNKSNKNYKVKSISCEQDNEYVKVTFEDCAGKQFKANDILTFEMVETYQNEIEEIAYRQQGFDVNLQFELEEEEEIIDDIIPEDNNSPNETVPEDSNVISEEVLEPEEVIKATNKNKIVSVKTGDNVITYIAVSIVSLALLFVVVTKKSTVATGANNGKHGKMNKKGPRFFSMFIIAVLILPTASKATTVKDLVVVINSKVSLESKLEVIYVVNGTSSSIIVPYGEKIENLANPEITGYKFNGWKLEDGTPFDMNTEIKNDTKIIANTEIINYEITYNLGDVPATVSNPDSYTVESDEITLNNPNPGANSAYTFLGWSGTGIDGVSKSVKIPKGSTGKRSYVANWEKTRFSITFDSDTGTVAETSRNVNKGDELGELPTPQKEGDYLFVGWYTNKNYTTKISASTKPEDDATYYARWVDRMSTVYSLDGTVTFFGGEDQAYTVDDVENSAGNKYINTGVELFNERNYDRDFEIGFEIVNMNDNSVYQQTIMNAKYENGDKNYPGFAFRRYRDTSNYEISSRAGNVRKDATDGFIWRWGSISKVVISRIGGTLYISIDGQEKIEIQDYSVIDFRFYTPVTFGASHDKDGNPIRYFDGTIKNMYIKLQNKVEDY